MARPWAKEQEVRLGVAVVALIGAGFFGITQLPRLLGPPRSQVEVRFPLASGVQGLAPGSPIHMAGLNIGEVTKLSLEVDPEGRPQDFLVTCQLSTAISVPRTATARVQVSPLGANPTLLIDLPPRVGPMQFGPDPEEQPDDPSSPLRPTPEQNTMATLFGDVRAEQIDQAITTLRGVDFQGMATDWSERLAPLASGTRGLSQDMRTDWVAWSAHVDAILDGMDAARAHWIQIEALFAKNQPLDADRLGPVISRIRALLSDTGTQLSGLRDKWNEEIEPPLSDLIARVKRDIGIIEADVALVMDIIAQSKGMAGSSSADLQMAGDQLARAAREITLMPWTLLGGAIADKGQRARFLKDAHEVVRATGELSLAVQFARDLLTNDPGLAERHPEVVELLKRWMEAAAAKQNSAGEALLNELLGAPDR